MDLAVKFRFFRHLSGGDDPQSEDLYKWHIEQRSKPRMDANIPTDKWKLTVNDYVTSAMLLHENMSKRGFDANNPIPIDPDGELLDGSHRVACALALEIEQVPVLHRPDHVWAPEWGHDWFGMRMDRDDFIVLAESFKELLNARNG